MLRKISDKTKEIAVGTAKASQKGIVEVDTIRYMYQKTLETISEIKNIEDEGRQKRFNNERELEDMEKEFIKKITDGVVEQK